MQWLLSQSCAIFLFQTSCILNYHEINKVEEKDSTRLEIFILRSCLYGSYAYTCLLTSSWNVYFNVFFKVGLPCKIYCKEFYLLEIICWPLTGCDLAYLLLLGVALSMWNFEVNSFFFFFNFSIVFPHIFGGLGQTPDMPWKMKIITGLETSQCSAQSDLQGVHATRDCHHFKY